MSFSLICAIIAIIGAVGTLCVNAWMAYGEHTHSKRGAQSHRDESTES